MSLKYRTLTRRTCLVATATGAIVASLFTNTVTADDAAAKQPTAFSNARVQPLDRVETQQMPDLDIKALRDEDAVRDAMGEAPRYAVPQDVRITPDTHGTWERVDRDTLLWRLRISSENALSINLGFSRYNMPEGGRLFLYNADRSFVVRPFTAADNAPHGELWTPPVPSGDIVIELTLPANQRRNLVLELGSINLGYRGFHEIGAILSGACNIDVICEEGDEWRDEIPAIAVISTGGSTFCTGFMVNNVRNDLTPYFMTAEHCGVGPSNAASLVVFWNYENSYCRVPGSGDSGGAGDGTLDQFNTGSTHRAEYGPSDVTLVELTNDPDPSWFISYAGWDATGDDADEAVGIHHPSTDEKRISFQNYPTTTTSYLGESVPGDGTHVRIIDWDEGTTEPGSSGSPLFNQDHRVIGQLHGGYASCTSQTSDWYGKFSVSFVGGGSPGTSLKPWLDPDDTGTLVVDTLSTMGMSISPAGDVVHEGLVGGPFSDDPYEYTLTNNTANNVDYEISLTNDMGIEINGGTSPVTGTLSAGGGTDSLTVTLTSQLDSLPAGVYEEVIVFEDLSTGVVREITHTVEIGQTGFTTSPSSDFLASGPSGGPFDDTRIYTITSTKPTPVNVTVSADEPWIAVDGSSSAATYTLNGVGDSADVEISFTDDANDLPNGIQTGLVSFTNDDGGDGDTARSVLLDVGRLVFYPEDLPQPIEDQQTITSTVDVDDDFCIGDVEVELDVSHTYIGDLTIDLISPAGVSVRLHDRTGGSSEDINTIYAASGEDTTQPDGPGSLNDFNYYASLGEWTLTITDHANADQGSLDHWALRLAPFADDDCPTPTMVHEYSFDSDPNWDAQGIWEFGEPTGASDGPSEAHTGDYIYATNLSGDYPDNLPATHLVSEAIDCTGLSGTQLRFRRWLYIESATWDDAAVSISTDGQSWSTIWEHSGGTSNDNAWLLQSFDISEYADNEPTVYLRWTLGPTDGSVNYAGWHLDDVQIWAVEPADDCPADLTGDGNVNVSDMLELLGEWGGCSGCDSDLNGDDEVNVSDLLLLLGEWGDC